MNAARLNELLARPQTMAGEDLAALENLCRDFPAFSPPFILLAKAYHDRNDYRYKESLHAAALRCPNRIWLHTYITAENAVENQPAAKAVESEKIQPNDDSGEVPAPEGGKEDKQETIILPTNHKQLEETSAGKKQESVLPEVPSIEIQPPAVEKPWRGKHVDPAAMTVYSIEDHFPPVEEDSEAQDGRDFFSWLRNPNKSNQPTPSKPETREEKDDLIRRFLETRPSVSRPKKDFFNPVNMARQSEQEDPELVTETLANIYLQQGNTDKAIAMFEKLILKYPGKRPYFAALIQKIRQEKDL